MSDLLRACADGDLPTVRLILELDSRLVHLRDSSTGYTPLLRAVEASSEEIVHELLARGADPNLPDWEGSTPLHHAVDIAVEGSKHSNRPTRPEIGVVQLLLAAGANPSLPNKRGETALDWATRDHPEAFRLMQMAVNRKVPYR